MSPPWTWLEGHGRRRGGEHKFPVLVPKNELWHIHLFILSCIVLQKMNKSEAEEGQVPWCPVGAHNQVGLTGP